MISGKENHNHGGGPEEEYFPLKNAVDPPGKQGS